MYILIWKNDIELSQFINSHTKNHDEQKIETIKLLERELELQDFNKQKGMDNKHVYSKRFVL